ncbi:MAG: PAS domain-containing sensor histidine kinase [Candidatus Magasanikbacteria bacterium]|nr:PAS domain-containing sensor histidine kinase [Candidatus Magasanikbacteria bacterium]
MAETTKILPQDVITTILSSLTDGVIIFDAKKKVILANPAAMSFTGLPREGYGLSKFYKLFPALDLENKVGEAIKKDKVIRTEEISLANFFFEISITPALHEQRGSIGGIIILHDVTRLKELDRSKTEFVSLASHQLRTPLTGIRWTAELFLEKEKLTESGKKYLRDIIYSASRLNTLIKLMLNISRIESGRIMVAPEDLDLVKFTKELISRLQTLSEKKDLKLIFTNHLKKLAATTDRNALDYILQDIIRNAIEYTPQGGKVEVGIEKKNNAAFFMIRDTGIGIPKQEQVHIFEKFFRASNAAAVKTDGSGLGLYIASQAAGLIGGKIWFKSPNLVKKTTAGGDAESGSTFYIEIPLVAKAQKGEKGFVPVYLQDK